MKNLISEQNFSIVLTGKRVINRQVFSATAIALECENSARI
jgi:hypothetical protein